MYNELMKNKFLQQFDNDNTKTVYKRVFKQSMDLENSYNKDLFNFNEKELDLFISEYLKPSTKQASRTYISIVSAYIQWAIENKYSNFKINYLRRNQDYYYKFVKNQNSLYLSKNQIDSILFRLVNAQDSFIILAIFNGVSGSKMSELRNMTIDDIKFAESNNGKLKLTNEKGEERFIYVDQDFIDIAKIAHYDQEYFKKNGNFDFEHNIKDSVELEMTNYILKPTKTNSSKGDKPITHYTIYNRLEMIKSLADFRSIKESLTTKNIMRSGMIYEAKKILDVEGNFNTKKQIEKVCGKFGIKYKWSLKDFLNEDTINEVYSSDMFVLL